MDLLYDLIRPPVDLPHPIAITIGNFDGVHRGHCSLFQQMRHVAGKGSVVVVSFQNHPAHFFKGAPFPPLICSTALKVHYLREQNQINLLYLLPFTKALANLSYDLFLTEIANLCPFEHLILGKGSCLGKDRQGTESAILSITSLSFSAQYLSKIKDEEGALISSHKIRSLITSGNLLQAETLLGHPYILEIECADVISLASSFLIPPDLCIPPSGNYVALLLHSSFSTFIQLKIKERILSFLSFSPFSQLSPSSTTWIEQYKKELMTLKKLLFVFSSLPFST